MPSLLVLCVKTSLLFGIPTQAIGTRLSELCHSDSESPANILGYIFDEETKRRMRKEDEEEDYLDDSESSSNKGLSTCSVILIVFLFGLPMKTP